jgi:hypothetical protein
MQRSSPGGLGASFLRQYKTLGSGWSMMMSGCFRVLEGRHEVKERGLLDKRRDIWTVHRCGVFLSARKMSSYMAVSMGQQSQARFEEILSNDTSLHYPCTSIYDLRSANALGSERSPEYIPRFPFHGAIVLFLSISLTKLLCMRNNRSKKNWQFQLSKSLRERPSFATSSLGLVKRAWRNWHPDGAFWYVIFAFSEYIF